MDARSVVRTKRDGGELSEEEMRWFLGAYVRGEVADYQAAALVACIFTRGMTPAELALWTRAMLESGSRLSFEELPQKKADKHSTGGIGDKVSIPLAPAVAACGVAVPMISGRGLGHTGGTLDKLEAIAGFRVRLSEEEMHRVIGRTGVAFGAQTAELVPADRKLYQLRDATGLVESIPLIASSIMSKKLAEGLDALVLDVKFGTGAFLPDVSRGAELARVMLELARSMGVKASAFHTAMDRPVGAAVGHALEIAESLECLEGGGPADLRELVLIQGGEMLRLCGRATTLDDGKRQIADALDSGRARRVFELVVSEQGGDPKVVSDPSRLPRASHVDPWKAGSAGVLSFRDLREVGWAAAALGGGRVKIEDVIDPAVGLVWRRRAGERVETGDVLCEIHHQKGRGLEACRARLAAAVSIGGSVELAPLVRETWSG
ncbi:MAG: thymidine phosphorylase [Planctomycetota bacterium]|nr:thymidine phosphorylase [Planctomycetota bacterium]